MTIGVLALQGDFLEHQKALESLGHDVRLVRSKADLAKLSGLVIPGGESTTMALMLKKDGLGIEIVRMAKNGTPILGTCAGAILLAKSHGKNQYSLNLLDVSVERNAYGTQIDSFEGLIRYNHHAEPIIRRGTEARGIFIRAPKIISVGPDVSVFGTFQGSPVAVMQGRIIATTYHPEISHDLSIHRLFVSQLKA